MRSPWGLVAQVEWFSTICNCIEPRMEFFNQSLPPKLDVSIDHAMKMEVINRRCMGLINKRKEKILSSDPCVICSTATIWQGKGAIAHHYFKKVNEDMQMLGMRFEIGWTGKPSMTMKWGIGLGLGRDLAFRSASCFCACWSCNCQKSEL